MKKYWISSLLPLKGMIKQTGIPFILPLYHTTGFNHSLPYTKFLYQNRTEIEFEHELDFLLKHFEPVDLQEILNHKNTSKKKPAFHITIDDGLASNYELIAPVLYKKGIPATFFINPAFIDDANIMHRYKASLLLDWLQINQSGVNLVSDFLKVPNNFSNIKNFILDIRYPNKNKLDECVNLLGISWKEILHKNPLYLTTQQLHNIQQAGFHIGAHSWDHPEYELLSFEEQQDQTLKSVQYIKEKFNPMVSSFAFPFTDHKVSLAFFEWLHTQVDLSFGCAGFKSDSFPGHFQRIPIEKSVYRIQDLLLQQSGMYYVKKLLGKHIVKHA
ncbi:MAG: polysaccharide deacetylase family protein [Saprospiraceae bacterium]|nr:polysaccharide deacetylase family protein [Saprospiraceae bacterium]